MINLSRNKPLAILVGAAGFLGSHLSDKLLEKGVQVVGVDDLSTGRKENIDDATRDKNFHLLHQKGSEPLPVDLPRLDYAYFLLTEETGKEEYRAAFDNFLSLTDKFTPKIVLVSSIELYDHHKEFGTNLQSGERRLAEYAKEKDGNARVLRLAAIYGPRMHFRGTDPIFKLVLAAGSDELQKEPAPLDFTTRALFVLDAVDLLIKATLHGATAQKIYDGALLNPIKIAEIRQVLLDPIWHENKSFKPTELPPWATPNLLKTEKELSWKPGIGIVEALKKTLHFLQNNPSYLIEARVAPKTVEDKPKEKPKEKSEIPVQDKIDMRGPFKFILAISGLALFIYAVVLPLIILIFSVSSAGQISRQSLELAVKGEGVKAAGLGQKAEGPIHSLNEALGLIRQIDILNIMPKQARPALEFMELLSGSFTISRNLQVGNEDVISALQIISGGKEGNVENFLKSADTSFAQADEKLSFVVGRLQDKKFASSVPGFLKSWADWGSDADLQGFYLLQKNIGQMRKTASILPQIVPAQGERTYIYLLFDGNNLKFGGGEIKDYGQIIFKDGKLLEVKPIGPSNLDKQIQSALAEPDFPTLAKTILALHQTQTGITASGVLAANIAILGQDDLKKLFFMPGGNWLFDLWGPSDGISKKQNLVYMSDPALENYVLAENFGGAIPPQQNERVGIRQDFLEVFSSDLGQNESGNPDKKYNLEKSIDGDGGVTTRLGIGYAGRNFSAKYQGQVRVYLEAGEALTKLGWGSENLFNKAKTLSDFGRVGYQADITLLPGEQKDLVWEFKSQKKIDLQNKLNYSLGIAKQPGTGADPLTVKVRYPATVTAELSGAKQDIPQEFSITSDLSEDRSFDISFNKL